MKLFIKDRIYILQMLPQHNSFIEFNLKRKIGDKIAITESERKKYKIVEDSKNGMVTWDLDIDSKNPIEVNFTDEETNYLINACEKLTGNQYPDDFWLVVEKIYNSINKKK